MTKSRGCFSTFTFARTCSMRSMTLEGTGGDALTTIAPKGWEDWRCRVMKSLSSVMTSRRSRLACPTTDTSVAPRRIALAVVSTSCPSARSLAVTLLGTFSSVRKRAKRLRFYWDDFFLAKHLGRVLQGRTYIPAAKVWILLQNLGLAHPGRHEFDDEVHRDSSALDYRLPSEYLGVNRYSARPCCQSESLNRSLYLSQRVETRRSPLSAIFLQLVRGRSRAKQDTFRVSSRAR